jgi:sensor histidine kinase YesM
MYKKQVFLENELVQNQIAIMLSQIQPHFLYNALGSIKALYKIDPKTAEDTLVDFSNYLRGNMDSLMLKEPITFARELQHVKTYLAIEKKRFEDDLSVVFDINTEDFMLPALTLQPIVENAVRHGIQKKDDGGTVTIKTEKTDNAVIITVIDDGIGFDIEQVQNDERSHIGIENVRNRLKANGGSLEIQSNPCTGTTATIMIPMTGKRE